MKNKIDHKIFIRNLEFSIFIFSAIFIFLSFLILRDLKYVFSLIAGIGIAYLNLRSTKNDGIKVLEGVKNGLSPEKGIFLYMSKFYLRLFATGILLFFFIKILKLNPFFILLGLFLVYFELIIIALRNLYFRKLEII
uniref:Uncharacterized protein n=1 Tax=Thermodesulfobacterium geofontis TaxID=1295609 RepID=A0A7C4NV98_9BACT